VILCSRDFAKGSAAAGALAAQGLKVEALALDVTDAKSIASAAQAVTEKHGRLDILVNNAGTLLDDLSAPVSGQSLTVWRRTFETNLFGVIAVTQAFLPLLHKSPAGRIVNVTSQLGSISSHADPNSSIYHFKAPAYNVSKTALNGWTVQLAYELRNSKIKVNAGHPGHVQTDMGGANAPMDLVRGAETSVTLALLGDEGPSGTFVHLGEPLPW
jgi:NAD(P)-dependent dehydrogenase (short-subunit alcohol dehydrogenase family)